VSQLLELLDDGTNRSFVADALEFSNDLFDGGKSVVASEDTDDTIPSLGHPAAENKPNF